MRTAGGVFLLALSLFMLLGFIGSEASLGAPATWVALAVVVVLPAAAGGWLVTDRLRVSRRRVDRRDLLRRQTIESEILRLAGRRGGRLTLVEIGQEMAITTEAAQEALDALVLREVADVAVTDTGTLVYTFRDIERLGDKASARHVLE